MTTDLSKIETKAADELASPITDMEALAAINTSSVVADATLRTIESFDDAMRLIEQEYGAAVDISREIGNGFGLIPSDRKGQLVGKGFILTHWRIAKGNFGYFTTLFGVTTDGVKFILNDGSTGIRDQLVEFSSRTGRFGGMLVPRGLRVSEYEYEDVQKDGTKVMVPASTYYLDTSTL